ncbi:MAG: hypothetical protein P8L66_12535 [Rhodospirillaceae bacterium]|nr:hypothetical protein [Rhodospirillaceae bacterium]
MSTSNAERPSGPGLIFGPGPEGWWDSERVSCPKVMRMDDGTWRMWYYGRDKTFDRMIGLPTGRVGLATSDDGIHWKRVRGPGVMGSVLDPHTDPKRFDSSHVGVNDVYIDNGLYWMWYFGGDQAINNVRGFDVKGFPMRSGAAISRDGIHWTRIEGPYNGALLNNGEPSEFDSFLAAWPQIIRWDDGSWRLYYHTLDANEGYIMAWAESEDGLRWEKRGPLFGKGPKGRFDDYGSATRQIIKINGQWTLFYEGCQDVGTNPEVDRQIGLAVSDDGITWERVDGPHKNGSIIPQSPRGSGLWDHRLGCPWVVPMDDGTLRLYYIGSNERDSEGGSELSSVHQIGMAVSDGDITKWERWTA